MPRGVRSRAGHPTSLYLHSLVLKMKGVDVIWLKWFHLFHQQLNKVMKRMVEGEYRGKKDPLTRVSS